MDRRKSLKALAIGTISSGVLLEACKLSDKNKPEIKQETATEFTIDRTTEEAERDRKLLSQHYFDEHEMATIAALSDIIIPKDEVSGSATEAKVPAFIDTIVIEMPHHQVPLRGGLRWLDLQCVRRYNKTFKDCTAQQQIEIVDQIAYPDRAKDKPELAQGVAFFSLMRNLTATGFYTSEIGIKDIGYVGNAPNQWNGVPDDVLKQYGLAYTEKELNECVKFDS